MVNLGSKRFAETTYEGKEFCIIDSSLISQKWKIRIII